jgi:hypothetical protein
MKSFEKQKNKNEKACLSLNVADPDPVRSGTFWSDPDLDPNPGVNISPYLKFFGVNKSHK